MTVDEALAGFNPQVNDVVKSQYQFAMYDGYSWIGSLSYMIPGKGYMYQSNSITDVTFTYPEVSSLSTKSGIIASGTGSAAVAGINAGSYEYSMSVVAKLNVSGIQDGYKLAAYVDGELRGMEKIENNGSYATYSFITIYGNKGDMNKDITFKLVGDNQEFLNGSCPFEGNDVYGSLNNPLLLGYDGTTGILTNTIGRMEAYPNPFSNNVTVNINLTRSTVALVEVYNATGKRVAVLNNKQLNSGLHSLSWNGTADNGESLNPGVYFIKMQAEGKVKVISVVKK